MRRESPSKSAGLLALRLAAGGLVAGHGAQKLFGWFDGHGLKGTSGWLESLGFRPGDRWALAAGGGEFSAGVLTALGLAWPAGPLALFGPMVVATRSAHAGKPIWVTSGGAELPMVYMAIAAALTATGPGRFAADQIMGLRMSPVLVGLTAAAVAGGTALALGMREEPTPPPNTVTPKEAPVDAPM